MWEKKKEYQYDYNMYITKPNRNKYDVYILIISILTLFFLILITKQSMDVIQRYNFYKQYQEKISKLEQEKQENKQEIEEQQNKEEGAKIPQLTDIGKQNIENIYHFENKRVFLTFDDGPSPNTAQILDILKNENIPATFFLLGNCVEARPDLVKRAYEEGHYIANHGYSHKYSSIYETPQMVLEEYNKCNSLVQNAIGVPEYNSHLFRFPGGFVGGKYAKIKEEAKQILNDNNIVNIDWNCLTGDSETRKPTKEKLMENLVKTSEGKNSVVVLMHDAYEKNITAEMLPQVINYFRDQGYEFKNFYEIIK